MTPYLLAVGLCLAALEERTGVPSWQLEYLKGGREIMVACRDAPLEALRRLRGGRLFEPAITADQQRQPVPPR